MIHLILGRQGSGKTLFLARIAHEASTRGKDIRSNVAFKFNYKELDYVDIIECRLRDCYVMLDEVHLLLPARLSLRRVNIEICDHFLSMARKQNTEIFGTTQTMRKVDIRFREEADYIYYCTKYAYYQSSWHEILHNLPMPATIPIMIEVLREETFSGTIKTLRFIGNPLYTLYDTYQIVKVRNLPDLKGRQ